MAKFHFVEDYEALVDKLIKEHPLDEAMSIAIGGGYEEFGPICADVLIQSGLRDGMSVLDFGCGSGRVAHALAKKVTLSQYLGTDVVQKLLNYAKTKTPKNYVFVKHHELSIPAENETFDFAFAFSVFTHLLQAEIYIYLEDIHRTLKPKGRYLFSFLEMTQANNWTIFNDTVAAQKQNTLPHLNMFLSRDQIQVMAQNTGFKVLEFVDSGAPHWGGHALGQSVCLLEKN
jgi:ubiquinone/menaquinone biosynthesis C-methylase UbiE